MLRQFLNQIEWTSLPVMAMGLFLAIFLVAVLRVLRRGADYRRIANLPLQPDQPARRQS